MKREEATAGRWIEKNQIRMRISGHNVDGHPIVEERDGCLWVMSSSSGWTLLPAECDSFDWQPETFPQWWTTIDGERSDVAFVKRHDEYSWRVVRKSGKEGIDLGPTSRWDATGRKQITEAEAIALLDKPEPVESPDDWVTQDRVLLRSGDHFRWIKSDGKPLTDEWCRCSGSRHRPLMHNHVDQDGWRIEIRCRRKDLPPLPDAKCKRECFGNGGCPSPRLCDKCGEGPCTEMVKPATRKVVLTEWLVECNDGDAITMWRKDKPYMTGGERGHAIGTREIEVPM